MHGEAIGGRRDFEYNKPENQDKYRERWSAIDSNVIKLFNSVNVDMLGMLGDELYGKVNDIVNEDIFNGKYEGATYENGLVFHIGSVNEGGKRVPNWDELATPEYMKPKNRARYDEQYDKIDPKVLNKIKKVMRILSDTLDASSTEYMDACNKINQDIYDGRYEKARYEVVSDEGGEFERGIIVFDNQNP